MNNLSRTHGRKRIDRTGDSVRITGLLWQLWPSTQCTVKDIWTGSHDQLFTGRASVVISEACLPAMTGDGHDVPQWDLRVGSQRDFSRSDTIGVNAWQRRQFESWSSDVEHILASFSTLLVSLIPSGWFFVVSSWVIETYSRPLSSIENWKLCFVSSGWPSRPRRHQYKLIWCQTFRRRPLELSASGIGGLCLIFSLFSRLFKLIWLCRSFFFFFFLRLEIRLLL